MSTFDNDDLEKLNEVYWEMQSKGTDWSQHRYALARIYYACAEALNVQDVAESVTGCEQLQSDLVEEDTTLIAERQE